MLAIVAWCLAIVFGPFLGIAAWVEWETRKRFRSKEFQEAMRLAKEQRKRKDDWEAKKK